MSTTRDVQEFLFFDHDGLGRMGEALLKMSGKDRRIYNEATRRLGRAMNINAPGDAPIGPEAEKLFGELQKMVSEVLTIKERANPGFVDVGRDMSDGHID
jgi:hypothetical protein